jgi:hypothetical protein
MTVLVRLFNLTDGRGTNTARLCKRGLAFFNVMRFRFSGFRMLAGLEYRLLVLGSMFTGLELSHSIGFSGR